MDLGELEYDERLALLGLMGQVAAADKAASSGEAESMNAVAAAFGEEKYREYIDEVESRFDDGDSLKAFMVTIDRREARELIYGTVLDLAMANTVSPVEESILEWLAKEWEIEVSSDSPAGSG